MKNTVFIEETLCSSAIFVLKLKQVRRMLDDEFEERSHMSRYLGPAKIMKAIQQLVALELIDLLSESHVRADILFAEAPHL